MSACVKTHFKHTCLAFWKPSNKGFCFLYTYLFHIARGTITSLSNAAMYAGTTVGTCVAGFLYQNSQHFGAVTGFTAILFILSMALYQTISKTGKRRSTARAQM